MYEGNMDFVGPYKQLQNRALEVASEATSAATEEALSADDENDKLGKSLLQFAGESDTEPGWYTQVHVHNCMSTFIVHSEGTFLKWYELLMTPPL